MPELSSEAQEKIAQLKQAYISSLPEKVTALEECWSKLKADPYNEKNLMQFRTICHKLAGSSGSYGLNNIFNYASRLEQACMDASDASVNNRDDLKLNTLATDYRELINLLSLYSKSKNL